VEGMRQKQERETSHEMDVAGSGGDSVDDGTGEMAELKERERAGQDLVEKYRAGKAEIQSTGKMLQWQQ